MLRPRGEGNFSHLYIVICPLYIPIKSRLVLLTHFPLSDTARAGLPATLAGALQLQLAGRGGSVDAVVQFLAQRATRQVAVDFALPLAVAAHHNPAGHMGQIDAIIRLVHLLAALAAAAHKFFLQVIPVHPEAQHHFLKLL